jgi:hypothetical protein
MGHNVLLRVGRADKSFPDVWGQWTAQLISGFHAKAWNFGQRLQQLTQNAAVLQ